MNVLLNNVFLAALLITSNSVAMKSKKVRIINDTDQSFVAQLERINPRGSEFLCSLKCRVFLKDFSYKSVDGWCEHSTIIHKNTAYHFTMSPHQSLNLKIFMQQKTLKEKHYFFESIPYLLKLSTLLAIRDSHQKDEEHPIADGGTLRSVRPREYSPRISQEPFKARL